jgi:hypothetical protein
MQKTTVKTWLIDGFSARVRKCQKRRFGLYLQRRAFMAQPVIPIHYQFL